MKTIFVILVMYAVCVLIYTYIVRNSATCKYVPDIELWPIVKDGMKAFAIGFSVLGIIWYGGSFLLNYLS
jgi:hypothetical protein